MSSNLEFVDRYMRLEELREINRGKELDLMLKAQATLQNPETALICPSKNEQLPVMKERLPDPTAPYAPPDTGKDASMGMKSTDSGLSGLSNLSTWNNLKISLGVVKTPIQSSSHEDLTHFELWERSHY